MIINLQNVFFSENIEQIEKLIDENPNIFQESKDSLQKQIIVKLIGLEKYQTILSLAKKGAILMDIYELDSLERSLIEVIFTNILFYSQALTTFNHEKLSQEEPRQEALVFFGEFISLIENIEENIANSSLLKIALEKKLPREAIQLLIDAGCRVDEIDTNENTLLHLKLTPAQMEVLIQNGAPVNQYNKANISALEKAIDNNQPELVKILLENGADISVKNKNGSSLFQFALVDKGVYEIYDLLCEYGSPNFDELNNDQTIFLYEYIRRIDTYSSEVTYEYLRKILGQGASVTTQCKYYDTLTTPLDLAIKKDFKVFEIVLQYYSEDINLSDDTGNTLLHKLCLLDINSDTNKARELYKKVKLVLEKGADTTLRNTEDKLPHELAILDNAKEKIVQLLLKHTS
ncbi:ankyrin repeat domain-containing protein [Candidatus Gracilibacteria bacterium]|nr:ankyrin repeat domain-containing protein [Candidatus Gracilibacteria bacterium]